jgi:dTDP-4-amino-4,6-dideoxygalactose transaminase
VASVRTIPLSFPWLDEREEELVSEVLGSGRLSLGPTIDRFEEAFAAAVGAPYAAAVSSGTAGLHLLCITAGVGPGDEVVTSPYSFVASANCAIYEGATPVFADVDRRTMNVSPEAVEAALTDRTRAVIAVDIYGYPCELDELRRLCDARGIAFVEDACEALGARYRGATIGSHGAPAVFAFYPNKQITTGEGGMITTHSESEWLLLRSLRNQGRADSGGWLEHARLGFNYRLDDIRAAIGLGQLEKLDAILAARSTVAARYSNLLADVSGLELPCDDDADHQRSWFVYVVTLPSDADREAVIAQLAGRGVQTARYLPCIHLQPYMQERFGYRVGLCPTAEDLASRTLALPFHARLDEDDQAYVADTLREALE